jgi:hypothetical protein
MKTEIEKTIEFHKNEILKLEQELTKIKPPVRGLHTEVAGGCLFVRYNNKSFGFIDEISRKCSFLSEDEHIEAYNQWRKGGMPIDSTPVVWNGKKYFIDNNFNLICDLLDGGGMIFNFDSCKYEDDCEDDNLERFEHNLMPMWF